jgi:hypothetical protein
MPRCIIGLAGLPGAGKSAAADRLIEKHGFERVKFSGPLKDMVRALGFNDREIEGDLKETPSYKLTHTRFTALVKRVPDAFRAIGVDPDHHSDYEPVDLLGGRTAMFAMLSFIGVLTVVVARGEKDGGATPRLLMQMLGTDWAREQIKQTFWTDLWSARVDSLPANVNVVVDDCRFPNEVTAAHAKSPFCVVARISRPGTTALNGHVAELQTFKVDITVENVGTLDDLLHKVDSLVLPVVDESPSLIPPADTEFAST